MSKSVAIRGDGFDTFTASVEGQEENSGPRVNYLSFGVDSQWRTGPEKRLMTGAALLVTNLERRVVRRAVVDGKIKVVETQVIDDGKFPNLVEWNNQLPKSEWVPNFNGVPEGPWAGNTVVMFLDPATLEQYHWTARMNTEGSVQAVRDLRDKVAAKRAYCGESVVPLATLTSTHMPTKFGGRQRPHFEISDWSLLGKGGAEENAPALPPPSNGGSGAAAAAVEAAAEAAKAKVMTKKAAAKSFYAPPVAPNILGGELNDEIPDLGR
jgi:hypothetical protein